MYIHRKLVTSTIEKWVGVGVKAVLGVTCLQNKIKKQLNQNSHKKNLDRRQIIKKPKSKLKGWKIISRSNDIVYIINRIISM